jgi:hypothetical protein
MSELIHQEVGPDFIQTFDELAALASLEFGEGQEVSFQPHGRYEEGRQVGTVRMWAGEPDIISINFMGSKVGIEQPDNERVTRAQDGEIDGQKIIDVGYSIKLGN